MSLSAGERFGAYEIVGPLGAGGMGEVYRATDPSLGRQVAIKILPESASSNPERLARFDREARLLAALNHPHIGTIFGREQSGETVGLVLELVEGPTLAERLEHPLRWAEARTLALQIIDAVSCAHESGIIHRDLKPANIKVTPGGAVKILDFGLAKMLRGDAGDPGVSKNETISIEHTARGTVLGTAAYMSPEQARGHDVDRRTDIWAFGCIVFEMLTGRRAFGGDTTSDTIAAVIGREPDWTALPADVPDAARQLLTRCLAKEPKRRLRDIADARFELETGGSQAPVPAARSQTAPWAIAAVLALALVATGVTLWRGSVGTETKERVSFVIPPPPGVQWASSPTDPSPSPAPNGHLIAFGGIGPDGTRMWIHDIRSGTTTPVSAMRFQTFVAWAPDSTSFAYCTNGQIVRVNLAGAAPNPIVAPGCGFGLSWGTSGQLLYSTVKAIWRVDARGGQPQQVTLTDQVSGTRLYPGWLPDGRHFVYLGRDAEAGRRGIYLASIDGGPSARLVPDESAPVVVEGPDGRSRLLFVRGASLVAQVLNVAQQRVEHDPVVLADRVLIGNTVRAGAYGATSSLLVHRSGGGAEHTQLVELDRAGRRLSTLVPDDHLTQVALSPDETTLAVQKLNIEANNHELWQVDLQRGGMRPLRVMPYSVGTPVWAADGNRLGFVTNESGIWRTSLLSPGANAQVMADDTVFLTDWSRDGEWLLGSAGDGRLTIRRVNGDAGALEVRGAEPRLSPNMKWLAYRSSESGTAEVYVRGFPDGRRVIRVSQDGGYKPSWRADGRELYYRTSAGTVMSVVVTNPVTMELGEPTPLFTAAFLPGITALGLFDYAVSGNGQRFFAVIAKDAPTTPLTVVLNWLQ